MCRFKLSGYRTVFLLVALSCTILTPSADILNSISYVDSQRHREKENALSWEPPTPSHMRPDYSPLQFCSDASFTEFSSRLSRLVTSTHDSSGFEWTSVSVTTLKSMNKTYLLLGGSAHKAYVSSDGKSVTPRDGGSVFLCEFEMKSGNLMGFGPTEQGCSRLSPTKSNDEEHEFLGSSTATIVVNSELSLLAYCDPLWRAKSNVPVGRCFLSMLSAGHVKQPLELSEFCQSDRQLATPCMAGHSLAFGVADGGLVRQVSRLKNVQLWVGQPLFLPHGRAQIIHDPYGSARVVSILPPDGRTDAQIGSQFGYALADGFVTAPDTLGVLENENASFVPLIGLQSVASSTDRSATFGLVDWLGSVSAEEAFSGAGISVLRVNFASSGDIGVILGAPYHETSARTTNNEDDRINLDDIVNRGRIYLYCVNSKTNNANLLHLTHYDDYLDGPTESTFFGFALSLLGDIDGDGYEEVAIGAPDLSQRRGFGRVYIIRLRPGCRFDRTPIQELDGPMGRFDFGAHLPSNTEDMDFNGLADLAVPSGSDVHLFLTRATVQADCRFSFPPWLAIRRIVSGDLLPIQLTVYFNERRSASPFHHTLEHIFADEAARRLFHQIDSDLNVTEPNSKRFSLYGSIRSQHDLKQKSLFIEFDLVAQQDVQDMLDIDSHETGLFIKYRFLQSCFGSGATVDENGTCPDGGGVRRSLIDWSTCVSRMPLSRFVCYPNPTCESDVSLAVTLQDSVQSQSNHLNSEPVEVGNNEPLRIMYGDLIFGEAESSRPQLIIEVFNHGPTFAGGTWLELQFLGNLRFSRLSAYDSRQSLDQGRETKLKTVVTANETWVACYLGTLPPPNIDESGSNVTKFTSIVLKLVTYYANFMNYDAETFTFGASLTATLITGTPDPHPENNQVRVDYRVIHEPRIRISYGPKSVPSRMDNRTRPVPWIVDQHRRMDVNELGPRLEHTMQIEYLGPTSRLLNVTFRAFIPTELSPTDYGSHPDPYLVYLFREVRSTLDGADKALRWVDVTPKLTTRDDLGQYSVHRSSGSCSVVNAAAVLNPKKLVGMDIMGVRSRTRRHTEPSEIYSELDSATWNDLDANETSHTISTAGSSGYSLFRRIPKEILQCDRVGYRLEKPVCAQVICRVDELHRNRPVLLTVTGWLWARTLFDKHISDVDLVTALSVDQGDVPAGVVRATEPVGHFYLTQTFFFPQIRPKLLHQIPMWPIVVGVALGILFLAFLIILLYVLGFFKRKRPPIYKAQYSKGGADELEQHTTDTTDSYGTRFAGFGPPPTATRYDSLTRKKRRGRHRAELTILHPADLVASQQSEKETDRLCEDEPLNGKDGHLNIGLDETS